MKDPIQVEYRVRKIERYIVTRFVCEDEQSTGRSETRGEYGNAQTALEVAHALCKAEHERLGWPIADNRIQYPNMFPIEEDGARKLESALPG